MGDGAISDGQISASSQLDAHHGAINGRLTSTTLGSWSAFNNDVSEWLQIDLGSQESTILAKIATQGENANSQWVKNYTLQYSGTGMTFQIYKEQGKSEGKVGKQVVFKENTAFVISMLFFICRKRFLVSFLSIRTCLDCIYRPSLPCYLNKKIVIFHLSNDCPCNSSSIH